MSQYSNYNDEKLIVFLRSGDHAAFTEIFNRHWGSLLDAAYQRLKSREAAEEVTQEVFVSLYLRREEIAPKSSLEAYLKTALKYKVIDAYRSQQQYYKHLNHVVEENKVNVSRPDELAEMKELRQRIRQVADKLPEKCREAFLLSRFEELSHQEVAERMGISVLTVRTHINNALKVLKQEFGDERLGLILLCLFVFLR